MHEGSLTPGAPPVAAPRRRRPRVSGRHALAFAVAALGVAIGGFIIGARGGRIHVPLITVGVRAPEFRAHTLDVIPATRTLKDYDGEVVLLNLWATWCGPCEAEMPSLERLHHELSPRGLKVVAVSVDDPGNEDRVRDFASRYHLTFDVLNEGSGKIESDYQSQGIPSTYLIDRDGVIRMKVLGARDWNEGETRRQVERVLDGVTRGRASPQSRAEPNGQRGGGAVANAHSAIGGRAPAGGAARR